MSVVHLSYAADGGASRAGRRASQACSLVGVSSQFAFIRGEKEHPSDLALSPGRPAGNTPAAYLEATLQNDIQWGFIPAHRTDVSNTLFSIPYPGVVADDHRLLGMADILHLHWPTWAITPAQLEGWLRAGRHVFWTLHDCWPMTGGCHYPAGCLQYRTMCMKCPQISNDLGLVANAFAEKQRSYGTTGSLTIVAPSDWMANLARGSAILRGRSVHTVRNPVELDIFVPPQDREGLRQAMGVMPHDLVLLFGSFDLVERRKGVGLLLKGLQDLAQSGRLAAALEPGARVHLAILGKSADIAPMPGVSLMNFGSVTDDKVVADIFGISDAVCMPSLEDNYPNIIVEAAACGTPTIGFATGGMAEMIKDGTTGLLVPEVGSISALQDGVLRFICDHFRSNAMRRACRTTAERENDPVVIGLQLRGLYEQALGRSLVPQDEEMRKRAAAAFTGAPVRTDISAGRDFLQFPVNLTILSRGGVPNALAEVTSAPRILQPGTARLVSVRTYHEHHSGHSGPYQFLRHLPEGCYDATHLAVPLGATLSGTQSEHYNRLGRLMGVRGFGQQGNAWMAETELLTLCAAEPVDLVHFIDGELGGWLLAALPDDTFHKGRRPVMVTTLHQPKDVLRGLINPEIMRRFDGLIALCEAQREYLSRYVPAEKVFVAPHGISTSFFRPPPADQVRPAKARFRLLLVGHWLRDLNAAIAAFLEVAEELDAELTVISHNFPAIRPNPRIILKSGLTDEELREHYWAADALLLPLLDATANNAVLEAMACGLAVITSDVGGVREYTGDKAAVLGRPGDVQDLVEGMRALAGSSTLRRRMGRAGRKRAEALDWSVVGRMHSAIYQTLLARRAENSSAPVTLATK